MFFEVVPGDTASPWSPTATRYRHALRPPATASPVRASRDSAQEREARRASTAASVEKAHDRVRVRERSHNNELHLTSGGGKLGTARR